MEEKVASAHDPYPSDKEQTPSLDEEEQELHNLTRIASSRTGRRISHAATINEKDDPRLDPTNPAFDQRLWAKLVLRALDQSGIVQQTQGVVFSNLCVSGSGSSLQIQNTISTQLAAPFRAAARALSGRASPPPRQILHGFDGFLKSGELLLVLGRPGSGCTTFLKTLCGHLGGLTLEPQSTIHYQGIEYEDMIKHHRGEVAYNKEVDQHFPHLTVGETLSFAAHARTPQKRIEGLTRSEYVETLTQVVLAVFGLSNTYYTKVGDNFVRGVSGGERKRVSIAEMFVSRCRIGAWDNSTRGLDASSALKFVRALRIAADMGRSCHAIAAYQASQSMYDLVDKVVVLYEGREIYFGHRDRAVPYFEEMGWELPDRQVSGDFLTSITNPGERKARPDMVDKVPRTAKEFEEYWKRSPEYKELCGQIEEYQRAHPPDSDEAKAFKAHHEEQQARHTRPRSPYLLSVPMQVRLCLRRAFQRLRNDLPTVIVTVATQPILGLVIGSIFFNSPPTTATFFQKGAVLYFAVLFNALIALNEIIQLYSQRPIAVKQAGYAFVHPFAEALASWIMDLPIKFTRGTLFCVILYLMSNLRREPSQFFICYMFLLTSVLTMSGIFRSLAAATRTSAQAMSMAGVCILCIVVYTGFVLPQAYMHPWLSWIRWVNPIYYVYEALLANEFHGRNFECASVIPSYATGSSFICSTVGAVAGERFVSGDAYVEQNYQYYYSHVWRNYGILVAYLVFFTGLYLFLSEYNSGETSKAETLVFRSGHVPQYLLSSDGIEDGEAPPDKPEVGDQVDAISLPQQTDVLSWKGLNYDIPVKDGTRRLLDNVNGWVKPGTLTALMGVSGAGKTTLLDVLAQRVSIGVVTGDVLVNGRALQANFPRETGYVQQQDLHMETTTVREALRFSAMLRQPASVSEKEKYEYVEEVIKVLRMQDFAEAVVGSLGEGLNVEQRKLLSIGVELAAKPTLLIFLDEPTSGLDSQSSWTICSLLRRLADHGQAVLATIHQPSALLFQTFDRLLFLAKGGKTVYFGDIGDQSRILLDYFERSGIRRCGDMENPAEYILEVVAGEGSEGIDWVQRWNDSPERKEVLAELERLQDPQQQPEPRAQDGDSNNSEFAMPFTSQLYHVMKRAFQQYYRQPEYVFAKYSLGIACGLFIGFSFFKANNTQQGFQCALFSVFLLATVFTTLVNQITPRFVAQRALYEVRERPSRVYSWKVFILSNVLVEIPYHIVLGVFVWLSFYWAVMGTGQDAERHVLGLLYIVQFYLYVASMAHFVIAAVPQAPVAGILAVLMFAFAFIFNGMLQPPGDLPGFWIFMYRVSPFTYYTAGVGSSILHGRPVECSATELSVFDPPSNYTCGQYMQKYVEAAGGQVYNPNATSACEYCSMTVADEYLALRWVYWKDRWRDYGIFWCYFVFNIAGAVMLYYFFRVKKWGKGK
ncbi:hypothetical protein CBS115989_975 [Aspergillus niger]|uniref:ABC transporter domain-containing protein n=1 Tax=Aspergillus niger ATCC 13496 TaxID=1353008 RepID=A0A370BN58_ASPNG|nr:hypothetical protein CBS115989_975 [Aspergillus niger]KAI2851597.1 hypothetical protein CBS11232_5937 [Aspergillus niger]KAI2872944.1 hypothetical protein CBS115988_7421 [Aspergillus niger]RDH17014.1 hypothetical protein M747DRAFT_298389 [Aspergillus niger ATCC 13496]